MDPAVKDWIDAGTKILSTLLTAVFGWKAYALAKNKWGIDQEKHAIDQEQSKRARLLAQLGTATIDPIDAGKRIGLSAVTDAHRKEMLRTYSTLLSESGEYSAREMIERTIRASRTSIFTAGKKLAAIREANRPVFVDLDALKESTPEEIAEMKCRLAANMETLEKMWQD